MSASRVRVLLVSVTDEFTGGLAEWLTEGDSSGEQFVVAGRLRTGAETLECLGSLGVDLILADVTLPDMSGFELARRVKAGPDAPLVVLLSFHDSQTARFEAMSAGADGFVPTSETTECLIPLVGDLLRRRGSTRDRGMVPGIPKPQRKPVDLSE